MKKSEREQLFTILSSKLEKEDAETLEQRLSLFIIEKSNREIRKDILDVENHITELNKKYIRESDTIAESLKNVANESRINTCKMLLQNFNVRLNSNKDKLIEILK